MNQKERIILAQIQIDNLLTLTQELQYQGFLSSHLLPVKYELQRQYQLLTNTKEETKIKKENNRL
jgi:hypothetical protein